MNLVQAIYLNNAVAPFDNVKVRQALCYAVDVDAMLDLTADGHGTKVGSSMYPAFTKYFDASSGRRLSPRCGKGQGAAGRGGLSRRVHLHHHGAQQLPRPTWTPLWCWWSSWLEVGITAEIEQVDWNTWLTDVYYGP